MQWRFENISSCKIRGGREDCINIYIALGVGGVGGQSFSVNRYFK